MAVIGAKVDGPGKCGAASRAAVSRARRCLFGRPTEAEQADSMSEWRDQQRRIDDEKRRQWNFDFRQMTPLPGRWQWEPMTGSCQQTATCSSADDRRRDDADPTAGGDPPPTDDVAPPPPVSGDSTTTDAVETSSPTAETSTSSAGPQRKRRRRQTTLPGSYLILLLTYIRSVGELLRRCSNILHFCSFA